MTERSTKLKWMAAGAAISAAVCYFFDPASGRRRRALAFDQVTHFRKLISKTIHRKWTHLNNRAHGLAIKATAPTEARREERNLSATAEQAAEIGAEYLH